MIYSAGGSPQRSTVSKSESVTTWADDEVNDQLRGVCRIVVRVFALGWLVTLAGCRERATESGHVAEDSREQEVSRSQIQVGVSGCAGLVQDERGLVCLTRKPKPLHLWLEGASDPKVELRFDGLMVESKSATDPGGVLVSVDLPKQRGQLELDTRAGRWEIDLVPVSDRYEALRDEVQQSWKAGDATAALQKFNRGLAELDADEAGLLGYAVAPVLLASGDHERVVALAAQLSGSPTVSSVGKTALLAAYVQIYLRPDFNAADQSLSAAEAVGNIDLETRIGTTYLRGVLEHRLGKLDESLVAFERAARLAHLVGDEKQYASALVMQAVALARLGRFGEAEALARDVEEHAAELTDPHLALDIRSSVIWISVLRRDDEPSIADPSATLREMIHAYSQRNDRRNVASRRLDLVLTLIQNSAPDAAAEELHALDPEALEPDLLVWYELAGARIELLRRRFSPAQHHIVRAQLLAELNQNAELEWQVAIVAGELEHARGNGAVAIKHYRKASEIADDLALAVTSDAGRSRFVTTHSRSDLALIDLLLEHGETMEAMCTAMAARARHLRGLWVRLRPALPVDHERRYRDVLSRYQERKQAIAARLDQSWELSTAELEVLRDELDAEGVRADRLLADATAMLEAVAPSWSCERALPAQPKDAVLIVVPSSKGHWTGMLAHRTSSGALVVEVTTVPLKTGEQAGKLAVDIMLGELSESLSAVVRLRVIPVGSFSTVDVHELLHARGMTEPTVTYSLGLGFDTERVASAERRAVVVAGSSDLAAVDGEAAFVRTRLAELGWAVDSIWDPSLQTQPTLLHYAGHGYGSMDGWRSAIESPRTGRISAAQIVAGQRAPELVVLGACGAGRVAADSIDGGMNLAAAFLLAGARLVVAPIREVDDQAAFELARGLYRELDSPDPDALARALARMQREEGRQAPAEESFGSWRAWTP